MNDKPLLIRGARLLDPGLDLDASGDVLVENGSIRWIGLKDQDGVSSSPSPYDLMDARGLILCPGFVDLHCHLREPGFEYKETITTGTRAAAAGGFTTICCMPNTAPPLDNRAAVEYVLRQAKSQGAVRVLPIACVSRERKGKELAELMELAEAGAVGFSDDGDPIQDSNLMRQALSYTLPLDRPVIDHCEDSALSNGGCVNEGMVSYRLGLKGVPSTAEVTIVARDLALAELTGGWVHIAHVSAAGSVELIRQAKARGVRVTAEVTPHHLTLTEDWVMGAQEGPLRHDAYNTQAKVNPPLRTRRDCEALLQGLRDGTIDAIATDHAPHTRAEKECEFDLAAFGMSGLETAFGLLMQLVDGGEVELKLLVSKLTAGPAKVVRKGYQGLKPGVPADLVLLDPQRLWRVESSEFRSLGKNTPLEGLTLKGKVVATLIAGRIVYQDASLVREPSNREKTP